MAQAFVDIATGTAANTISSTILVPLIQQIDDVIHLEDNRELLEEQLNHMKSLLLDINSQFQDQQRETPASLKNCLLRMQRKVGEARELIHRSQQPRLQQCIDYLLCKPNVFKQIQEWNKAIPELNNQLGSAFSVFCSAQQIASTAPQQAHALLQDEPDTGLVGVDIKAAETQLQRWVLEAPHVRIIGICGMGGVGKTTLLKKVYNTFKEDAPIPVDYLVHLLIAEGVVKTNEDAEYDYVFKTGQSYVKLLENRCLFQVGDSVITVHDVVHDMAIYIGENEENCVARAGQSLQHFPDIKDPHNCKRISVSQNNLTSLSATNLRCPKLVSLFLDGNPELKEIPEAFFLNFPSLRVLDLSWTPMKSLPTSLWQLTQLEWLRLDLREIDEICEDRIYTSMSRAWE